MSLKKCSKTFDLIAEYYDFRNKKYVLQHLICKIE